MNGKYTKSLFVVLLLIQPTVVLALDEVPSDVLIGILSALFGELPPPCAYTLSSPDCVSCMIYIKLFPFTFIFSFFFIMFYLVVERMASQAGTTSQEQLRGRPYYAGVVLISVILSFVFVHYQNAIDYVGWWATIGSFMIVVWVFGAFFGRSALGGLLALVVIGFMFFLIHYFILGQIQTVVAEWKAMCLYSN